MIVKGKSYSSVRAWLHAALEDKKKVHAHYSLRNFSKCLGISKSTLSGILCGKRPISYKSIEKLSDYFNLSPEDCRELLAERLNFKKIESQESPAPYKELDEKSFALISDWHFLALLALCASFDCPDDLDWFEEKLPLNKTVLSDALNKLESFRLLERKEGKIISHQNAFLAVLSGMPSVSVKKFHKQTLSLAEESLEQDSIDKRKFSSMTLAINSEQLDKYEKLVQEFQHNAKKLLQTGPVDSIYSVSNFSIPLNKSSIHTLKKEEKS